MRLLLFLLVCLLGSGPAFGEVVVVTRPWVQVRQQPKPNGKPIAIVYGNDSYDVLKERGAWVQIRTAGKVTGWVPKNATYPIVEPIARKSLAFATALKSAGKDEAAHRQLFEIVRRYPGTVQSYEATRMLLAYHPYPGMAPLPDPVNGKPEPHAAAQAERMVSWLLVEEGRRLIGKERYAEAVSMFEEARVRGKLNRTAMDGIRETLQNEYKDGSGDQSDVAKLGLKAYFPNIDNPETFTIKPLGKPPVVPPTQAPLVEPGPPIEEQPPPALHDFEKKELEMAPGPGEGEMPEKKSGEPAPEAPGQPQANPPGQAPAKPSDTDQAKAAPRPARPHAQSAPAATPPRASVPAQSPPMPRAEPPPMSPRVKKGQAQAEPNTDPGHAAIPHAPQDMPPGFGTSEGITAQAGAGAQHPPQHPMKRRWPQGQSLGAGGSASGAVAAVQPPPPPPTFSDLSERPPPASVKR